MYVTGIWAQCFNDVGTKYLKFNCRGRSTNSVIIMSSHILHRSILHGTQEVFTASQLLHALQSRNENDGRENKSIQSDTVHLHWFKKFKVEEEIIIDIIVMCVQPNAITSAVAVRNKGSLFTVETRYSEMTMYPVMCLYNSLVCVLRWI